MLLNLNDLLPPRFNRWLVQAYARASQLHWGLVLFLGAVHFVCSYTLLWAAAEVPLLPWDVFWYFYITTATTVGYGDLSPATSAGRYVVTLFIMPGGIILFTTLLAKMIQDVTDAWRKRMKGLKDYAHITGHIAVVGWREQRTMRMVQLIRGDISEQREIILLADLPENPLPDQLSFVQSAHLSAPEAIQRAGIPQASLVIVLGQDDNESLTAALAVAAIYDKHLVVYFEQASYAQLLKQHCPNAEAVVSLSAEYTVRVAQDPGSSHVVSQLLSNLEGQTQYCLQVPEQQATIRYGQLFQFFKSKYDATLLGLSTQKNKIQLNPPITTLVTPGTVLYFMAAKRLHSQEIQWSTTDEANTL